MTSRRGRLATGVAVLLVGLVALLATPSTHGALLGKVTNSTNTAATGIFASTKTCTQVAKDTAAYFAYPLNETRRTTVVDATGNGRSGTYSTAGVTYNQAGPCPRDPGRSVQLNGSTGLVRGPGTLLNNPQTFSVQVWFRTSTTSGGKLVGFGDSSALTGASVFYDRHVYMTNDGRLAFGVFPNYFGLVESTSRYNDDQWHQVVGTLSASTGLRLYVDGLLVDSDPSVTSAQVYNGYWRFGGDNLDTWPDQPSSRFFAGFLSYGAVWTTALTADQVQALYRAGL